MNKRLFQRVAKTMFTIAGDMKKTVTFVDVTEGTYDPILDAQVDTEKEINIGAIVSNYTRTEVGDEIRQTDFKCRILPEDIARLSALPRKNDNFKIDEVAFSIENITKDMADASFVLQIRQ